MNRDLYMGTYLNDNKVRQKRLYIVYIFFIRRKALSV